MTYMKELEDSDLRRARVSLIEELEAIDNYEKRIEETKNAELKKVLTHNMNEEKEHVAMLMEWIRSSDSIQDKVFEEHN